MTTKEERKLVLLVEDDPDVRDLLAAVLEEARYEVLRACHGADALSKLEQLRARCHLILLDLMMPVMNGWDFRRKQRANPALAEIPVLLMSAGAHLVAATGDLNVAGYVAKPVEIPDLLAKVQRYCA
jgi:CheY-like chemotaxis protein